jgi:hypothetical protein|tara:strand:- start:1355 stop:1630 length:276 start_codon:yes stop_codon:yes gene_type:complete
MNVNGLGLFRALDIRVRDRRKGIQHGRMHPEQLATDVVATYAAFDEETLEKVWEHKRYAMQCVEETKGGNTYERHRPRTDTKILDVSEPVV